MKKIKYLVISILAFLFTFCSTGNVAYKQGDYYKACLESIDFLRSNPKSKKAQTVLLEAYPLAIKNAQRDIDNALMLNSQDKYDVLVNAYEKVNNLADQIYKCPKAYELIPKPTEFITELAKARELAAEFAYNSGIKALNAGGLDQSRAAYQYFQNANRYVKGYKDVLSKLDEARYYATLRVIVQKPYTNANFQYSADYFFNNLLAEIRQNTQNRFIRYYSQEEARKENMQNPHQYIVLNFEDFTVGNIKESSNTSEYKRDSVVVGTVKIEGKIYNSYNTVTAKFTTFRREVISSGVLSVRIIDVQSNQELQRRNLSGSYVWNTNWANYKGDDRALTEEQKRLCSREPQNPPSQQDLFIEFSKPIYNQAVSFLRSQYSRY